MKKILVALFSISILFVLFSFNAPKTYADPRIKFYDCADWNYYLPFCDTIVYKARYNSVTSKWSVNSSDMGSKGWDNRADGLKVIDFPAGTIVEFYEDKNFGGVSISTFVESSDQNELVPDLDIFYGGRFPFGQGFRNQMSSFRTF